MTPKGRAATDLVQILDTLDPQGSLVQRHPLGTLRADARKHIERGAVTADYRADLPAVIAQLNEVLGHADLLAARIVQLGGQPDFAPSGLVARSHAEYVEGITLADRIRENLVAERIAVNSARDMLLYLGTADPTTSELLKGILAVEEQHADELAGLLQNFPLF